MPALDLLIALSVLAILAILLVEVLRVVLQPSGMTSGVRLLASYALATLSFLLVAAGTSFLPR